MIVKKIGPGPWANVIVLGATVQVQGITLDCAARHEDAAVVVDICDVGDGTLAEGAGGAACYVASARIPPRIYKDVPLVDEEGAPVLDCNGKQEYTREGQPLDGGACTLTLWTWRPGNAQQ